MKILCVFGKNDYGNPSRGEGYEYRNFIPGFESLGNEVIHFDSWNRDTYNNFSELNQALLDCVEEESPDVLFCVPLLYEIWIETLNIIYEYTSVKTVLWCTDDSWKYREVSRYIAHVYDLVVTTYANILPFYKRYGITHVMLSQWAADISTLKSPICGSQCDYSVVFIGSAHGDRKDKVRLLEDMGINVQTFGYGWESGPVDGTRISEIIRNAQITLNFSNSKGENQLKARNFEVPGAGGFLLTEAVEGLDLYYVPGLEIEVVSSIREMADKIKYYINNKDARDFIAENGYNRTRKEHLYGHRFEKILVNLSNMPEINKKTHSGQLRTYLDESIQAHQMGKGLSLIKKISVGLVAIFVGKKRSQRFARRVFFEIGWRFFGKKTFCAAGWPGRMFYRES